MFYPLSYGNSCGGQLVSPIRGGSVAGDLNNTVENPDDLTDCFRVFALGVIE